MRRSSSTVVCIVGPDADQRLRRLGGRANVVSVSAGAPPEGPDGVHQWARSVADATAGAVAPYVVTGDDPLAPLRDAWLRRFSGEDDTLEEYAGATLTATVELPDYYLIAGGRSGDPAETLRLEWYAGAIRSVRSSRVAMDAPLDRLPSGPWWPAVSRIVEKVRIWVPPATSAPPASFSREQENRQVMERHETRRVP